MPVGQYLLAAKDHLVIPEHPYPVKAVTRSKTIDFCLMRCAGDTILHAVEAKWIGKEPRSTLVDEIFDDLYRLAILDWPQAERCQRWLLVAGVKKHVQDAIFKREINAGNGRKSAFGEIFAEIIGKPYRHRIYTIQGKPRLPHAQKWKVAAESLNKDALANGITSTLCGKAISDSGAQYCCYVWRIALPQGCGYRTFNQLFPALAVG